AATATYVAVFFGIATFMLFLPTWLEAELGFTASRIAVLYLIGGVGTVFAGPRAGALSDRIGRRLVILWSSLGIAVFALLMPALVGLAAVVAFPTFLAVNIFLSARASAFQALLTELVGSDERGSLLSLTTAAGQLGFASGAAAAGPAFAGYGFGGNAAIMAFAAVLAAAVVWWLVPESQQLHPYEAGDCPCNSLQVQPGLCGPTPECGHMARVLQASAGPAAPTESTA
ncbi:MAG: MFS transporter, partial [Acidobacteriota bacterium]